MGRMSEAYAAHGGHISTTDRGMYSRAHATCDVYPHKPALGKTDTSNKAAGKASTVTDKRKAEVKTALAVRDMTNSEVFQHLAGLTDAQMREYLRLRQYERSLQPRSGELKLTGHVFDSGQRRKNLGGKSEIVWSLRDPNALRHQPQLF